jgi:hypothetical protein
MIHRLLTYLFGCSHERYSWPMAKRGEQLHVCCLTCGRSMEYDWAAMRRGK